MSLNLEKTKRVDYRGILSFEIPEKWVEEYDDELGGTFYEDIPNSATFRLNLISLNTKDGLNNLSVIEILDRLNSKESDPIVLPNQNAYKMYYEETIDSGHKITTYYWCLAQVIQPNKARLANFSYTVLSEQLNLPSVKQEINFITQQVENVEFGTS